MTHLDEILQRSSSGELQQLEIKWDNCLILEIRIRYKKCPISLYLVVCATLGEGMGWTDGTDTWSLSTSSPAPASSSSPHPHLSLLTDSLPNLTGTGGGMREAPSIRHHLSLFSGSNQHSRRAKAGRIWAKKQLISL